jgi:hypothetical protein
MKPKKHKAVKIFFIIICLIFGLFFVKEKLDVNTSLDEYDSKYIYVENRTSKNEVIKKNHKVRTCPASLTKIMTTIVALEHIEDLSAIAPVDVDTYKEMVNNNSSMADRIVVMTSGPGKIKELIDVSIPRPRSRGDQSYGKLSARILDMLEEEVTGNSATPLSDQQEQLWKEKEVI